MRRILPFLLSLVVLVSPLLANPAPAGAADCQFVLGFRTLQELIPSQVGDCLTDVQYNPQNGDALQRTTGPTGLGGLLVWRKSDNFTAFTDGFRTWVNGPFGLQVRLNSQRLFWERNAEGLPIVPPPAAGERCHTAGLSLSLQGVDAGAGNFVATFRFRNNLAVVCTFFGFPGAQLLDAQNNALPTNVVRGGGLLANLPGPGLVVVPAGGSATFQLHWGSVEVGAETSCPTASQLAVIPPDEFAPLIVPVEIRACDRGRLNISAVQPAVGVSSNWSGYAATGGTFTGVSGTWTVPQARGAGILTSSAAWVGIGGLRTRDLIQAGTQDLVSASGAVRYEAWIELLPAPPQFIDLEVTAGDSMTVSIVEQSPNQWRISMRNNTSGQTFQTTVPYASSRSSAEWIQEAPSTRTRILPLSDFGTVQFTSGTTIKDGRNLTIVQAGAQPISMIDSVGHVISQPSALTADGTGFSVSRVTLAPLALRD